MSSIDGEQTAPNSSGVGRSKTAAPAGAADCHVHIYDPRFAPPVERPSNATVPDYRQVQARIGTSRVVIVTPRNYETDNSVTVDAVAQLGLNNARGIAVLRPTVTDAELETLAAGGICGVRFTLFQPKGAVVSIDMLEPMAKRIADLGWHVQIHMNSDQIVERAELLARLPTPLVFDHMGRLPQPGGIDHPARQVLHRLIDKGRTWVKLSAAYIDTKIGPPTYGDVATVAQAFVKTAPERLVWGTDWPHPTEDINPDDAMLFDLLADWTPNEATRRRILVTNPEALYGFATSA
jgi:D-galactarolactone isomerase